MIGRFLICICRGLVALTIWWPIVLGFHEANAQSDDYYDGLITVANGSLIRENYSKAFSDALRAIEHNGKRFEGYYFAAIALSRQRLFDRAVSYAKDALARVGSDPRRKIVEELLVRTERGLKAIGLVEQGERAEASGNLQLAASNYTEAFDADPSQHRVGQEAARMWTLLKESTKAARVLRKLATSDETAAREEANKQLAALVPELATISKVSTDRGWREIDFVLGTVGEASLINANEEFRGRIAAAIAAFELAVAADPSKSGIDSPHMGLLIAHAALQQKEAFYLALATTALNRFVPDSIGHFDPPLAQCKLACTRNQVLAPLFCAQDVQQTVQSVYGAPGLQLAQESCKREEQRKQELVANAERDQRLAKVNAALQALINTCHAATREGVTTCMCFRVTLENTIRYDVSIRGTGRRAFFDDEGTFEEQELVTYNVSGTVHGRKTTDRLFETVTVADASSSYWNQRGQNVLQRLSDGYKFTRQNSETEMRRSVLNAYGGTLYFDVQTNAISFGSLKPGPQLRAQRVSSCRVAQ